MYHQDKPYSKIPSCYKCDEKHQSYTCNKPSDRNFGGTCKLHGHRTPKSVCPKRPKKGYSSAPSKIYRASPNLNNQIEFPDLVQENPQVNENEPKNVGTDSSLKDANIQEIEQKIKSLIEEHMNKMTTWVLSILSLSLPSEVVSRLNCITKVPSEEFLRKHFNIIQSVDGHMHIRIESFDRKIKTNRSYSNTKTVTIDNEQ